MIKDGVAVGFRFRISDQMHGMYRLGFRDGDEVLSVNDIPFTSPEALDSMWKSLHTQQGAHFFIRRDGRNQCFKVRIADR